MMVPAVFLERPNRFVARVQLEPGGDERLVHVASSGRMTGLLVPGAPVMIRPSSGTQPGRKTAGLLAMVRCGETWVSADTSLPGKVLRQAFAAGSLPAFTGYDVVRPEVTYGESRIDFLLTGPDHPPCLVEVKSVTSMVPEPDGLRVARFPDAPTERGARHLQELVRARSEGYRTAVCFVIQRDDVDAFGPYDEIDPQFGQSLRSASAAGVEIHAWAMHVSPEQIALKAQLPVRL